MGSIKVGDTTIPDRRTNGARIRLDMGDWLKIITVIIVFILGVGNVKWSVENHGQRIATCEAGISENGKIARDNRKDIENMKASLDRIDGNVIELLKRK